MEQTFDPGPSPPASTEYRQRPTDAAPEWAAAFPAFAAVGLMLLWAAHDGGYDADTWYWGALAILGLLVVLIAGLGTRVFGVSRITKLAFASFAGYVGWSYLSIAWAGSPGDALQGSNRALLFLLVFALFVATPWTPRLAFWLLMTYTVGVGAIAVVILLRIAGGHSSTLFSDGRLVAPTGYFNASAALFTAAALAAVALAARREAPTILRGALLAGCCAELQLALLAQSRGWLFTLPLVALASLVLVHNRARVAVAALLPIAGMLALLSPLLAVFRARGGGSAPPAALIRAAQAAARPGLLVCAAVAIAGCLIAACEVRIPQRRLSAMTRRTLLIGGVVLSLLAATGGGLIATDGHPLRFVSRQWRGFTRPSPGASTGSHFAVVGSGRFDFWRVSFKAFLAHPVGGLGQDNFADYYVVHRRTTQEPKWTHSLEMRLLSHTGIVGFALFTAFLVLALLAAVRARRGGSELRRATAGAALLPLAVWLIHGSVDWFWEVAALTGPALGFLAMAGGLQDEATPARGVADRFARAHPPLLMLAGALALVAAVIVLGFPYLSVREVSVASDAQRRNPDAALRALSTAAELNPLSADPGRLGGTIALRDGNFTVAQGRFRQAIAREPGGWFAWLGAGLAASALGDRAQARHDFQVAESINSTAPAIRHALARVNGRRPLTAADAFRLLVTVQ